MQESILDSIGHTPSIHLKNFQDSQANIYAKMEYTNPGGSMKDRAALQIIQDAYASQQLTKGQVVVEMTSGNMGAGLALVCKQFNNPFIAVMPSGNSPERIKILESLGAKVVLSDQVDGTQGKVTGKDIAFATKKAIEISNNIKGYYVDQFNNTSCIKTHYNNTGKELWNDCDKKIDIFMCTVGTGATFLGVSKYLKEQNRNIQCIAIEAANAAIISTGSIADPKHVIQGTGYGLIPPHWDNDLVDDFITVTDEEVIASTKLLSKQYGLFVGYSSGANVQAAINYQKKYSGRQLNIATILCDTGYKYNFSTQ